MAALKFLPNHNNSVLAVFAHPDDESFLAGGTLAQLSRQGRQVQLLCLTRGEGGENALTSSLSLTQLRHAELQRCCEVLGLRLLSGPGYPDGGLSKVGLFRLTQTIARTIYRQRPQLVITFGPDGLTGHPDHLTTHRAVTLAFEQAALPGSALLYASLSELVVSRLSNRMEGSLDGAPLRLQGLAPAQLPLKMDIRATARQKWEALHCHRSQAGSFAALTSADWQLLGQREYFQPARLVIAERRVVVPGLLSGLNLTPDLALAVS